MDFEWDDDERRGNIDKHGVDLLFAARIFRGLVLTLPDDRAAYGEDRLVSVGKIGEEFFVVVHTDRAGVTRLISARKGGRRDRRKYQACFS